MRPLFSPCRHVRRKQSSMVDTEFEHAFRTASKALEGRAHILFTNRPGGAFAEARGSADELRALIAGALANDPPLGWLLASVVDRWRQGQWLAQDEAGKGVFVGEGQAR